MEIVKVLKRKDASSVVVAVILAFFVSNAIDAWSVRPTGWLSNVDAPGNFWSDGLWVPFITLVIQLVLLEVVTRIYTLLVSNTSTKK